MKGILSALKEDVEYVLFFDVHVTSAKTHEESFSMRAGKKAFYGIGKARDSDKKKPDLLVKLKNIKASTKEAEGIVIDIGGEKFIGITDKSIVKTIEITDNSEMKFVEVKEI